MKIDLTPAELMVLKKVAYNRLDQNKPYRLQRVSAAWGRLYAKLSVAFDAACEAGEKDPDPEYAGILTGRIKDKVARVFK